MVKLDFVSLLEIIFPPTDDERTLRLVTKDDFASLYSPREENGIISLAPFANTAVRAAIHLNKFHGSKHAKLLLSVLLEKWLATLPLQDYALVPIPLSRDREKERGYNQVTVVAEAALRAFPHISLETKLLQKVRATRAQTSLSREQRLLNLHGAFESSREPSSALRILLIDDVTTTGTTLLEAKKALAMKYSIPIICVALAH